MFVQLLSSNQFRTDDYGVVYVGLFVTIIPLVVVCWYFQIHRRRCYLAVLRVDGVYENILD